MSEGLLDVWPPLPPSAHLRRPSAGLPFPLDDPRCTLFALGRAGIYHGLQASSLEPRDEVLMPAYHHGSEVEATIRAGFVCSFYEGNERLEPDPDELESLLGPRVRALHLTHYLGFPQDAVRWRAWCDERGLLLVEDAAQAWLARCRDGRPVGSVGDLAVFCLYKTFGVPDGAALVSGGVQMDAKGHSGLGTLARRHAGWLAGRSGSAATLLLARRRERTYVPGEDFAPADADAGPTRISVRLIWRLARRDAAGARRAAYERLLDTLADHVPAPFAELSSGASPFAFPVETDRKAELLAALAQARIRALDLWSVPHPSLPTDRFPAAARRRASTVGLPVHQELRDSDVERIAAAAAIALSGRPSSPSP